MRGRGSRSHPEKKKHRAKPRSEMVTPLTDAERSDRAAFEFGMALKHLAEAERLAAWGGAPHACVHTAYYAMYHCAAAVLLTSGGVGPRRNSPASHTHVLDHFGRLVQSETGDLALSANVLARAREDRIEADYGTGGGDALPDGKAAYEEAKRMIDLCRERWNLISTREPEA